MPVLVPVSVPVSVPLPVSVPVSVSVSERIVPMAWSQWRSSVTQAAQRVARGTEAWIQAQGAARRASQQRHTEEVSLPADTHLATLVLRWY